MMRLDILALPFGICKMCGFQSAVLDITERSLAVSLTFLMAWTPILNGS